MIQAYDMDGDGLFEDEAHYQNLWKDDERLYDEDYAELFFETYTITHREFDENGEVISDIQTGNLLSQYATIYLAGPDMYEGEKIAISGEFVFEIDVPVMIDSRLDIPDDIRNDEHGTIAWYNSNPLSEENPDGDTTYELAFIFSEISWLDNIAIATYISRSGQHEVYTDREEFKQSGDTLLCNWWLDPTTGFEEIRGMTWGKAWQDYMTSKEDDDYAFMVWMDRISNWMIMATVGGFNVPAIPMYMAWEYFYRPVVIDIAEQYGFITGEGAPELGETTENGINDAWYYFYTVEAFKNFFSDIGNFGLTTIHTFEAQVPTFQDTTEFEDSLEIKSPDINDYATLTYKIPQIFSIPRETILEVLDFFVNLGQRDYEDRTAYLESIAGSGEGVGIEGFIYLLSDQIPQYDDFLEMHNIERVFFHIYSFGVFYSEKISTFK